MTRGRGYRSRSYYHGAQASGRGGHNHTQNRRPPAGDPTTPTHDQSKFQGRLLPDIGLVPKLSTERSFKYVTRFCEGNLHVDDERSARAFLHAILRQWGARDLTENVVRELACNAPGLNSIRDALRYNVGDQEFLNSVVGQIFIFFSHKYKLPIPSLQEMAFDEKIHSIILAIAECEEVFISLNKGVKKDLINEVTREGFSWFLAAYFDMNTEHKPYIQKVAFDPFIVNDFIDAPVQRTRMNGYKLQKWFGCGSLENVPGGRHDNDPPNFRKVNILPSGDEIHCKEPPFLVKLADAVSYEHSKRQVAHLDATFRTLREGMLNEIRADFGEYIKGRTSISSRRPESSQFKFENLQFAGIDKHGVRDGRKFGIRFVVPEGFAKRIDFKGKDYLDLLLNDSSFPYKHFCLGALIYNDEIIGFGTMIRDFQTLNHDPPSIVFSIEGEVSVRGIFEQIWRAEHAYYPDKAPFTIMYTDTPVYAYQPILKRLQQMRRIPLAEELLYYTPGAPINQTSFAPDHALDHIMQDKNLKAMLGVKQDLHMDKVQKRAIQSALTQRVTLIQGPPGTGKTLVGNIITKALLDHTKEKILVITQQNHICDEFLENLLDMGVAHWDMVRLGSQYTTRTRNMSITELVGPKDQTQTVKEQMRRIQSDMDSIRGYIEEQYAYMFGDKVDRLSAICEVAKNHHDGDLLSGDDLFGYRNAFTVPEQWKFTQSHPDMKALEDHDLFSMWSQCKPPPDGILEDMNDSGRSVWAEPESRRNTLMARFEESLMLEQIGDLSFAIDRYNKASTELRQWRETPIADMLMERRVIATTTNSAAKHLKNIEKAAPKILIVEEAAQIMESHILTALNDSVEQIIMIGDHKQLPPRVETFELQEASGKGYNLDVSMFKRLITSGFPSFTLQTQHRARPEIANLIRFLTYPELRDDPLVSKFENLRGLQGNLFWMHHENIESESVEFSKKKHLKQKSKVNQWEARMVVSVVRYLLGQGYQTSEIAVITPYLGQCGLISKVMHERGEFEAFLSHGDYHELVRAGIMKSRDAKGAKKWVDVSTVDQFQGSDRDIIILSMVRSNWNANIGFLASPERTNVMLSRARKGLIIIGNALTACGVKNSGEESSTPDSPWLKAVARLSKDGLVISGIPIICQKHPEEHFICRSPELLDDKSPEGGCRRKCDAPLRCGKHLCTYFCHSNDDHSRMDCEVLVKRSCDLGHEWEEKCASSDPKGCEKCEEINEHNVKMKELDDERIEKESAARIKAEKEQRIAEIQRERRLKDEEIKRKIASGEMEPRRCKEPLFITPELDRKLQAEYEARARYKYWMQRHLDTDPEKAKEFMASHPEEIKSWFPPPLGTKGLVVKKPAPPPPPVVESKPEKSAETKVEETSILVGAVVDSDSSSEKKNTSPDVSCDTVEEHPNIVEQISESHDIPTAQRDEIPDKSPVVEDSKLTSPSVPEATREEETTNQAVPKTVISTIEVSMEDKGSSSSVSISDTSNVPLDASKSVETDVEVSSEGSQDTITSSASATSDKNVGLPNAIEQNASNGAGLTLTKTKFSTKQTKSAKTSPPKKTTTTILNSSTMAEPKTPIAGKVLPVDNTDKSAAYEHDQIFPSPSRDEWQLQKRTSKDSNVALDEIMDMIGIEHVKEKLLHIKSKAETVRRQGINLKDERFHIALLGNPGTGKTTFARAYAKFLLSEGVLESAAYAEATGTQLASEGIAGVQELLGEMLRVKGGTLFIDEAYQLITSGSLEGRQVLDYLLSEMEKNIGKIVIIISGYNKEMERFFEHNPGLHSRFPYSVQFEDFTNEELLYLLQDFLKKKFMGKMKIEDGYNGLSLSIVSKRLGRTRGMAGCGNARSVQNAVAKILERQAARLTRERKSGVKTDDFHLTREDIIGPPPTKAVMESVAWKELNQLIGLTDVKESVQVLVKRMQKNYQRELAGEKPIDISLNRVFLGSPGTGKTSVAKIYGKILAQLGLLSSGEVILKTPSDFLGRALGDSEANTKAILKASRGKVLIIDEAYMLNPKIIGSDDPYKTSVIDTIVSEVQNVPGDDQCVLLLGYQEDLERMFQNCNPGLSRRFPISDGFQFHDYTDAELAKILDLKLRLAELEASPEAREVAIKKISHKRQKPNFGNAGEVENLLNVAKERMLKRHTDDMDENMTLELLTTDFDPDHDRDQALTNLGELFKDLIGIEDITERFEDYQATASVMRARGMDPKDHIPMLFIFKGPPGTGKTTTARKMGQIFYNMGFLGSNEVVECSASDLVAEYLGQTAQKTRKKLDSSLGKVLFIDEAYRLQDNQYGQEASNELVDAVTKPQYMGKLVIILAGYDEGMDRLLAVNVGLASRFAEVIDFPDVDHVTAVKILKAEIEKSQASIPCLESEDSNEYNEVLAYMEDLANAKAWGHARDALTLAKNMVSRAFRAIKGVNDPVIVSQEMVSKVMMDMLRQRKGRKYQFTMPVMPAGDRTLPPKVQLQTPEVVSAPKITVTLERATAEGAEAREGSAEGESGEGGFALVNDDTAAGHPATKDNKGVTHDDAFVDPSKAEVAIESPETDGDEKKRTQLRLQWQRQITSVADQTPLPAEKGEEKEEDEEAGYASDSKEALLRMTEAEMLAGYDRLMTASQVKQSRIRERIEAIQKELLEMEEEEEIEEAERCGGMAFTPEERVNARKLEMMGRCPKNYSWRRVRGGYHCRGGEHFVRKEEVEAWEFPE